MSPELVEEASEHPRHVHHHTCSNLFGCGDEKSMGTAGPRIEVVGDAGERPSVRVAA